MDHRSTIRVKGQGMNQDDGELIKIVQDQYSGVARSDLSNDSGAVRAVATAFGYSAAELESLPAEANMGLSCGNPVALASLRPGEVVVDLGCGGGLDVLLAAKQIGPTGKAIGIDMTPEMLVRARAGAAKTGATNVEFHQAEIDSLPLPDDSVDCIISNCVINLVPDKDKAFREMLRVLKPGGRVALSDIALKQPLPGELKTSIEAYVGCIAGAVLIQDYQRRLQEAGFTAVVVSDTGADLNAYAQAGLTDSSCCGGASSDSESNRATDTGCCGTSDGTPPELHEQLTNVLSRFDANAYAASVRVHAVKVDVADSTSVAETTPCSVRIYDRPMCCSTGVCGPEVDPVLPRFAADLDWLKSRGHQVQRFNLAHNPAEFVSNPQVQQALASEGVECLPLVIVDDCIVGRRDYPSRDDLATWTRTKQKPSVLPIVAESGPCCGDSGCC